MKYYNRDRIRKDMKFCYLKKLCLRNNSKSIATGGKVFIYRIDREGNWSTLIITEVDSVLICLKALKEL